MNDTVSEDVKLDEAGLEAAAIALSGAPFPMDASRRRAERAVRAYLAATKPASPLPGEGVTLTYEDQRLLKLMEGTATAWEHAQDTIMLVHPKSSAATLRKALGLIDRLRASPPMPGRGEGSDAEAAMRLMTSLGKTKLTWGELVALSHTVAASRPREDTHAE